MWCPELGHNPAMTFPLGPCAPTAARQRPALQAGAPATTHDFPPMRRHLALLAGAVLWLLAMLALVTHHRPTRVSRPPVTGGCCATRRASSARGRPTWRCSCSATRCGGWRWLARARGCRRWQMPCQ